MLLASRAVLITGAKRIGAALARAVAGRGASVAVSYNHSSREADATVAAILEAGGRATAIQADLSRAEACAALVDEAARRLGRLDVLVNMASIYRPVPIEDLDPAAWQAARAVDLDAAFACCRAAIPHLRRAGGGRIISIADWLPASGRPRYTGFTGYYVAKAGVVALTESLALELAPDAVLVNAIAPGPIVPPPGTSAEELKAVEDATPLGRWGGEDEIVKAALFLIDSDFVTGETIRVDGGRHLR